MMRAPIDLNSPEAEAYRSLRTNLGFSRLPDNHRSVLFTSPRHGEGKSTTAANFALVSAYSERPTLLIDADMRNPQQHRVFGLSNTLGLSTFLSGDGDATLEDVVIPTAVRDLDLVRAGPPTLNPAELLGRPKMVELLDAAKESYDWIILDSPPVLPVTDAAILSRLVDGVALVVNFRRTRLRVARKARELLRGVQAPVLGLVVNQAKPIADTYGRYPH